MTGTNGRRDDVVVVGGGLAGLTAACYLAREGAAVTVLEKSAKLGGRSATRELDGFLFNLGGHALYTGGATSRILDELGVEYTYGVPVDVFVLHDGGLSAFPTDPAGWGQGRRRRDSDSPAQLRTGFVKTPEHSGLLRGQISPDDRARSKPAGRMVGLRASVGLSTFTRLGRRGIPAGGRTISPHRAPTSKNASRGRRSADLTGFEPATFTLTG